MNDEIWFNVAKAIAMLSNFLPSQTGGCTLYVTEQPCSDCQAYLDRHDGLTVKVLPKGE